MKKTIGLKKVIGVVILMLALVMILAACKFGHIHKLTLDSPVIEKEVAATCTKNGSYVKVVYCEDCNEEIGRSTVSTPALGHDFVNGVCILCSKIKEASDELEFRISDDGTYYIVTGISTRTYTDIIIPSIHNGLPVTGIGDNAFGYCSSLTSITIPSSVETIGDEAFDECTALKEIIFAENSRLLSIGDRAFSGCSSLTSINLSGYNTAYKSIDGNLYTKDGKTLIQYAIGKTDTSFVIPDCVTDIGDRAFYCCDNLTSITIPSSVETIGSYAFLACTALKEITFAENSRLLNIGEDAFWNCYNLMSVTIPSSVETIGSYAFHACTALKEITFAENSRLLNISEDAFGYCSSLTSITIPSSVETIGSHAFYDCTALKEITFAESSRLLNIGEAAFWNCYNLMSVTIPDNVTSIGNYAFYGCSSLTSVTFENPNGWWRADSADAMSGRSISAYALSDPETAATYLKSTYVNYYWHRG